MNRESKSGPQGPSPNRAEAPGHCLACRGPDVRRIFESRDHRYLVDGTFPVAECARCGLVVLDPPPDPARVRGFYADEDHYEYAQLSPTLVRRLKNRLLRAAARLNFQSDGTLMHTVARGLAFPIRNRLIPRSPFGGTLLDIGCGNGAYLINMKAIGWDVYGCELSPSGAAVAQGHGLRVVHGTVGDARFPDAFFDVIRLEQVFEHLDAPDVVLIELRRILKPSGLLLIGVPNGRSLSFRLFGAHWGLLGLPFHLFQYSTASITLVLARNGFRVTRCRYRPFPICWLWSVNNLVNARLGVLHEAGFVNNRATRLISRFTLFPAIRALYLLRPSWGEMMQVEAMID